MNEWQCAEHFKLYCWWYKDYLNINVDIYTDTNTSLIMTQSPCVYTSVMLCNALHGSAYGVLIMVCTAD